MHSKQHPIWLILKEQGRSKVWLARSINYSYCYVKGVAAGTFGASAEFRRRCAVALNLPESVLFVGEPGIVRPRRKTVA